MLSAKKIITSLLLLSVAVNVLAQQRINKNGEPYAEDILNDVWKWQPYHYIPTDTLPDMTGFFEEGLGKLPKPYIHPRVLFSAEQVPAIRERINSTQTGQLLLQNLHSRTAIFDKATNWERIALDKLINNKWQEAKQIIDSNINKPNGTVGHYQDYFVYELMLKTFECLVFDKKEEGKQMANAFYNYCKIIKPQLLAKQKTASFTDDVWRSQTRPFVSHFITYMYDFSYNFLTKPQQNYVRDMIAVYSFGKLTMGMRMPPHFRNWNWINVSQQLCLNVLAIQGEKGYDARVYKQCTKSMKAFMDYGLSSKGSSKEAVGYTSFGFNWAAPALVAMARQGNNYITHPHFRAMKNWYLASLEPFEKKFTSHGDGGDGSPSLEKLGLMKFFYPTDSVIDYLWQNRITENGDKTLLEKTNIILPLIFATDPNKNATGNIVNYDYGAILKQPITFYDEQRGSLNTRSKFGKGEALFEMECRIDALGGSHEHADRGNFTFSSLGRTWTTDGFRGVESKYHNVVLINGKGQGFFAPPGKWLQTIDVPEATFGVCDSKYAYDYRWPKPAEASILPTDSILLTERYKGFKTGIEKFRRLYGNTVFEKDPTQSVKAYYENYQYGNPKMWDEDPWPVRIPYNPVLRAFRTAGLVRGKNNYVLIADDIQRNTTQNLYEWNMMVPWDLEAISINDEEIILGKDEGTTGDIFNRFKNNARVFKKGEPLLLVKVLSRTLPDTLDYESNPSIRVETIEKVNTLQGRERTFGLDKRLVIPSLSVAPNFKILLYPFTYGEKIPVIKWNEKHDVISVDNGTDKDEFIFTVNVEGRTVVQMNRNGKKVF
jgi:hypothetical protein